LKEEIKISLRNLLVAFLIISLVLFSTETILSLKNRKNDTYHSVLGEKQNVLLMQFEHLAVDKIFMSATNVYNATAFDGINVKPELKSGYPLINHLTDETKIEDAFNIVVISDSFGFGAYSLNRNELFWRLLENDFRAEGKKVNVFGVGATGANAYEELSWLTDSSLIEDLDPDFVIFGYVYNDSDDSIVMEGEEVNWEEELPVLSLFKKIFPNIYNGIIQRITAKTMYNDKYKNSEYVNYDCAPPILKGRFYEKYKTDFVEKLDSFAGTVDFQVAVVTLPTVPDNLMLEKLYEPLDELYASCKNIRYYNSADSFSDFASLKHSKNYSVNVADFHPGSATNRFYADYIKAFIQEDYPELAATIPENHKKTEKVIINEYLPYNIYLNKVYENAESVEFELEYPLISEYHSFIGLKIKPYLVNPLGKEHIKLSFAVPTALFDVKISGEFSRADVYYTCVNQKLNYDDHDVHQTKKSEDGAFLFEEDKKITSVLISADFGEKASRKITLTFKKSEVDVG